jgi:hypothetical protein
MSDSLKKKTDDVREQLLATSGALLRLATDEARKWTPESVERLVRSAVLTFDAATRPVTIDPPPDGGRLVLKPRPIDPPPDGG